MGLGCGRRHFRRKPQSGLLSSSAASCPCSPGRPRLRSRSSDQVFRFPLAKCRSATRRKVFDENGKFIDQWSFSTPSSVNFLIISADRQLWAFDDTTAKIVRYDLEGHLLYAWGTLGDWPGGLFNIHGASVDQQGTLYIAEVANGRAQKFRPRAGANPEFLVGKPVYAAWK